MTFGSTYRYKNLKLGLGLQWRTGKPYTETNSNNPINENRIPNVINYGTFNNKRLENYFRADASASYRIDFGKDVKMTLGLAILNITDRKNILNRYYRLYKNNSQIQEINRYALGITPKL